MYLYTPAACLDHELARQVRRRLRLKRRTSLRSDSLPIAYLYSRSILLDLSLSLSLYIYVCMYVCMYVYIYTQIYISIHTCGVS